MRIADMLAAKCQSRKQNPTPTIAFLGDSITQGCFELFWNQDGTLDVVTDSEHAFPRYVGQILAMLYPKGFPTIINAGASGGTAVNGLERLERDVLSHGPDLTVVSFGVNDCMGGEAALPHYLDALGGIFDALEAAGSEVIFLTQNMLCTELSPHVTDPGIAEICRENFRIQRYGELDHYFEEARKLCESRGIPVCDCYAIWQGMDAAGVNVTELLANRCNHPTREMNWLFAVELVKTMLLA